MKNESLEWGDALKREEEQEERLRRLEQGGLEVWLKRTMMFFLRTEIRRWGDEVAVAATVYSSSRKPPTLDLSS